MVSRSHGKIMSHQDHMPERETGIITENDLREPRLYRVFLHNDNYTTMDFVVEVLMDIFHKNHEEASDIMLAVHEKGVGSCGIFPREIAEFRVARVMDRARQHDFPLLCTMESE